MKRILTILSTLILVGIAFLASLFVKHGNDIEFPSCEDLTLNRGGYVVGYRYSINQPAWTSHTLKFSDMASTNRVKRSNNFKADIEIPPEHRVTPQDYKNTGFDKGHLVPAADMGHTQTTMSQSFLMSNMSPQRPECNQQTWRYVETFARDYVLRSSNDIDIISGPIFKFPCTNYIGSSVKIPIPDSYFKVLFDRKAKEMIGFIVRNGKETNSIDKLVFDVDAIERIVGLDLFRDDDLECVVHTNFWFR